MDDQIRLDRFRLKGNASFTIREGWLSKGLRQVSRDPEVFLKDDATEVLGVGSAMVKSIRFWMQATGLTTEPASGRRKQTLTPLGELILQYDPYFEDDYSLCQAHYHLATNPSLSTVWYLLFNHFSARRFSRSDMETSLLATFEEMGGTDFSVASFSDDCTTALRTYVADPDREGTPEDNMQCPLVSLGLIIESSVGLYEMAAPLRSRLHPRMVLYMMLDRLETLGESSVSLDRLLNEPCQVGKVFHLSSHHLLGYLDDLQSDGCLTMQRTAGLNMIYPNAQLTSLSVAQDYYVR